MPVAVVDVAIAISVGVAGDHEHGASHGCAEAELQLAGVGGLDAEVQLSAGEELAQAGRAVGGCQRTPAIVLSGGRARRRPDLHEVRAFCRQRGVGALAGKRIRRTVESKPLCGRGNRLTRRHGIGIDGVAIGGDRGHRRRVDRVGQGVAAALPLAGRVQGLHHIARLAVDVEQAPTVIVEARLSGGLERLIEGFEPEDGGRSVWVLALVAPGGETVEEHLLVDRVSAVLQRGGPCRHRPPSDLAEHDRHRLVALPVEVLAHGGDIRLGEVDGSVHHRRGPRGLGHILLFPVPGDVEVGAVQDRVGVDRREVDEVGHDRRHALAISPAARPAGVGVEDVVGGHGLGHAGAHRVQVSGHHLRGAAAVVEHLVADADRDHDVLELRGQPAGTRDLGVVEGLVGLSRGAVVRGPDVDPELHLHVDLVVLDDLQHQAREVVAAVEGAQQREAALGQQAEVLQHVFARDDFGAAVGGAEGRVVDGLAGAVVGGQRAQAAGLCGRHRAAAAAGHQHCGHAENQTGKPGGWANARRGTGCLSFHHGRCLRTSRSRRRRTRCCIG